MFILTIFIVPISPLAAADGVGADVHPWPLANGPSRRTQDERDAMKFDRAQ